MTETSFAASQPYSSDSRVAWVTGSAAPRVGQRIAREFAQAGYRIVIHANQSVKHGQAFAEELTDLGVPNVLVQGELSDPTFAKSAVETILERFGRIDVLVNAAAVWDWKSFEAIEASDVQRQFEVNTLGTFLCSQQAGLAMTRQKSGGAIILIGDWAVIRPYPEFASYFAGKGAIETMTRSLAVELATRNPNVRVNAILPGPVMLDSSISPAKAQRVADECLLKRLGTPDDVAQAARFLAEQSFITGVCLPVDGGRSIYCTSGSDAVAHPTYQ
jgi:pteridine reductase